MGTANDLVAGMIRESSDVLIRAAQAVGEAEFYAKPDNGPPFAWILLHLTGQIEWAIEVTQGEKTVHPRELLERFKGDEEVSIRTFGAMPPRAEILRMYATSVDRAVDVLKKLGEAGWTRALGNREVARTFGNAEGVWRQVGWHGYWHLGQLSAMLPTLAPADMTYPLIYRGELQ